MVNVVHPDLNIYGQCNPRNGRVLGYTWSLPEDIRTWLNENCPERWRVDVYKRVIVFEDNNDALRFKLLWL